MATVTIDQVEYDLDDLTEEAKAQLQALQVVDRKLQELQETAAILQTARNAYSQALKQMLEGM